MFGLGSEMYNTMYQNYMSRDLVELLAIKERMVENNERQSPLWGPLVDAINMKGGE